MVDSVKHTASLRMMCCRSGDVKAISYGTAVTFLLSCTMVVAGLKAGITPGVSPLVVLCGWGAFRQATRGPGGLRFLNLAQVSGSAGMAIVSGVIFTEPLLQVLYLNRAQTSLREQGVEGDIMTMPWKEAEALMTEHGISIPPVSIPTNILACVVGALIGYGFVGLATKRFLSDPSLPAPEAHACMSMIEAAVSEAGQRPRLGISLVLSTLASLVLRLLTLLSLAVRNLVLWSSTSGSRHFSLEVPVDSGPLYLGIGGLLTLPTALLVFAGALLRLVGDALLARVDSGGPTAADFPANSMRWVGGGAMTVAVVFSLGKFMRCKRAPSERGSVLDDPQLVVPAAARLILLTSIALGIVMIGIWLFVSGGLSDWPFHLSMLAAILIMAGIMVPLGAILSLQIGSSSSPVSGTVFVTTLVLCGVALVTHHAEIEHVPTITTLLVVACVAVCTANDASQDYKTLQLCDVPPREGFLAQLVGLLVGAVVVPCSLYVSHNAFGLGTASLPAPQGQMFATLVDGLLLEDQLPWYPVLIGLGTGILAVIVDVAGSMVGLQLPAMAMAVGIYLPPDTGVGIVIGSAFRCAGERLRACKSGGGPKQTHECVLAAAGMITGSAFLDLVLGIAVLFSFDPAWMSIFATAGEPGKVHLPAFIPNIIAVLALVFLGWILFHNSLVGAVQSSGDSPKMCKDEADEVETEGPAEVGQPGVPAAEGPQGAMGQARQIGRSNLAGSA